MNLVVVVVVMAVVMVYFLTIMKRGSVKTRRTEDKQTKNREPQPAAAGYNNLYLPFHIPQPSNTTTTSQVPQETSPSAPSIQPIPKFSVSHGVHPPQTYTHCGTPAGRPLEFPSRLG